jgi:transketolase
MGGDGDLSVSTLTALTGGGNFDGASGAGRNIRFGVREHAMAAAINGMAYHGGLRPYASTFFVFSDYMRPSLRMAALSNLPVRWIFTHDSLGVGEDGATHQPIEQLMALRAMPNVAVMRPADSTETYALYQAAYDGTLGGPVALVLGRQKLPSLSAFGHGPETIVRGGYVLSPAAGAEQGILLATGSEVHVALAAQKLLAAQTMFVRVVSLPCWELFLAQSPAYHQQVLPKHLTARVSVEAGATLGWCRFVGDGGVALGVDAYGASGPGAEVLAHYGMDAGHVARAMAELLGRPLSG